MSCFHLSLSLDADSGMDTVIHAVMMLYGNRATLNPNKPTALQRGQRERQQREEEVQPISKNAGPHF